LAGAAAWFDVGGDERGVARTAGDFLPSAELAGWLRVRRPGAGGHEGRSANDYCPDD